MSGYRGKLRTDRRTYKQTIIFFTFSPFYEFALFFLVHLRITRPFQVEFHNLVLEWQKKSKNVCYTNKKN